MSNYVKLTNFASKDSLASGNPLKIVKGTEIDAEFNNIATAVLTKADNINPAFTGTPTAPTATLGTATTQIATTAFVQNAINDHTVATAQIEDNAVTNAKMADNSVNTAELVASAVTADKLASNAVTAIKLASDAVTTVKILDANVTTLKLETAERMTTSNVATATAGVSVGAIGTYAMCRRVSGSGSLAAGSTVSGSELQYSSTNAGAAGSSGTPSGTWRVMGYLETTGTASGAVSLFLRIS